ncbi:MAG: hypothetical protein HY830_23680 [Actinobacteria bacterium]|nr:hypothetical protein [Actinomycetota bacterium]
MVLPLVPLVLIGIGAASGAGGAVLVVKGSWDLKKANDRIRRAGRLYDKQRQGLQAQEALTNETLKALGTRQEEAVQVVVARMAAFLRRHQKQVSDSEKMLVDGVETTAGRVALDTALGQDAVSWMRGVIGSVATGAGINTGIMATVTTFASASTGTAISSLSGAAATNATMAALGGGSLASGGAGMAAGAAALNFVTLGPALLVSGFLVAGQGEKALTKARTNDATINVAVAEVGVTAAKFTAIVARATELESLLDQLVERGVAALDELESEPFDPGHHSIRFQQALSLAVAVRDVACAHLIDEAGELIEGTMTITVRYRKLIREADNA